MMRRVPLFLMIAWCCARSDINIGIAGNSGLHKRKLLEVISPEPESYDKEGLRAWREDAEFYLADLYRSLGYFEVQIKTELKRHGDKPKDWDALFTIQEGPRYNFDAVRVIGADLGKREQTPPAAVPGAKTDSGSLAKGKEPRADSGALKTSSTAIAKADTARGAKTDPTAAAKADSARARPPPGPTIDSTDLAARRGKPYKDDAMLKDRRFLLRQFGNSGFVRVEVDDRLDVRPATKTVAVDYLVDAGLPVVFDTVLILNQRAPPMDTLPGLTRPGILKSLMPYRRGDTVRVSGNDKVVEKLQYTGAFNYVRIKDSLNQDTSGRSTLYLYTEEHVPGNLRSSVFYETQYGPGVSLDARHSNVAGTLNELRTGFSFAQDRQSMYGGFGSPLTFGFLIRFDDDVTFDWYQDQPIHAGLGPFQGDFRWANSARLTWPWSYWLRVVGDAELEAQSRMVENNLRERDLSLNFIQTAFLTFVNQPMDPTRGVRFAFTWGNGGPLQQHDVWRFTEYRHNWLEAQSAQYYYLPTFSMIKLATRLDGGRFFGDGGPNSQRFFLGGSRNVRSYLFQDLCPERSDSAQVCVGQKEELAYFLASAELRLEPFWFLRPQSKLKALIPLQVVPFTDFGKVWDLPRGFALREPDGSLPPGEGYANGLGLRYPLLGIFNLRLDWAFWGSGPKIFWLDLAQAF